MKTIYLIGMMGVGKSSIGRQLAEAMKVPFFDLDQEIEALAQKSINDIFAIDGEEIFRQLEKKQLRNLPNENAVVATGGGIVLDQENRNWLQENGTVVWLTANTDTIVQRLESDRSRPLLQDDVRRKIGELLIARDGLYHQTADFTMSTDGKSVEYIVSQVAKLQLGE